MKRTFQEYAMQATEELNALTSAITKISAPSHHEKWRAVFCARWLIDHGARNVNIDRSGNLIWKFREGRSGKWIIFSAHMDTVFEKDIPLEIKRDGDKWYCPGIGDDSANLAVMLMGARWCIEHGTQDGEYGVMFVGTVAEELGGLGTIDLINNIGAQNIHRFYSFDATYQRIYTGVVNYTNTVIRVNTPGGHALGAYGTSNAIEVIAKILTELSARCHSMIQDQDLKRTTFNAGIIRGGVKHNQIASDAELLVELRSDYRSYCDQMLQHLKEVCTKDYGTDVVVSYEIQEDQSFWSTVPEDVMEALGAEHLKLMQSLGLNPKISKAATDCRYPLSQGIPSLCIGLCMSGNPHTEEEYLLPASLPLGLELLLTILNSFF